MLHQAPDRARTSASRRPTPPALPAAAGVVSAVRLRRRQRLRAHRGSRALGGGRLRRPSAAISRCRRPSPCASTSSRPGAAQAGPRRFDRLRRELHRPSRLRGASDPDRDARRRVALRWMAQRLLERRDVHAGGRPGYGGDCGVRRVRIVIVIAIGLLVVGRASQVHGVQGEPGSARRQGPWRQARGSSSGSASSTPATVGARGSLAGSGRWPVAAGGSAPGCSSCACDCRARAKAGAYRLRLTVRDASGSHQELRPEPAHPAVSAQVGHAAPSEQPRALAVRIARVVSSTIGLAATILGVVFVLWPSLKPEAPPAARSATLSNVTLDRSVAFGQYLDRID